MHDIEYDPPSEMRTIFQHGAPATNTNTSGSSDEWVHSIEKMLDKRFEPLNVNMSMLEEKFLSMHLDAQNSFAAIRSDIRQEFQNVHTKIEGIEERIDIQDSNIDNIMAVVTKLDEDMRSRFVEHENLILNIKDALGRGWPSNFQYIRDDIKKIAALEPQLSMMRTARDGIGDDINLEKAEQWICYFVSLTLRYLVIHALPVYVELPRNV